MSYLDRVISAMPFDREVSPDDVAAIAKIDRKEVSRCLKLLEQGGVVECVATDRFVKNRRYKSRQRALAI